jgi:hypothetical protein
LGSSWSRSPRTCRKRDTSGRHTAERERARDLDHDHCSYTTASPKHRHAARISSLRVLLRSCTGHTHTGTQPRRHTVTQANMHATHLHPPRHRSATEQHTGALETPVFAEHRQATPQQMEAFQKNIPPDTKPCMCFKRHITYRAVSDRVGRRNGVAARI